MRRIVLGTGATALDYAVISVGAIVSTTFLLDDLGLRRYGIFVFLMLLSANRALSFFDLGLEGALGARIARAHGPEAASRRATTLLWGIAIYAGLGVVAAAVIALVAGPVGGWLARGDAAIAREAAQALRVLALAVAAQFATIPFLAHGLNGGTFARTKMMHAVLHAGYYAGLTAVAVTGGGLPDLAGVSATVAVLTAATFGTQALWREGAALRTARLEGAEARALFAEGTALLGNRLISVVHNYKDHAIILRFLAPDALGRYDLAVRAAVLQRVMVSTSISTVVPETARTLSVEGAEAAKETVASFVRYTGLFLLPVFLFMAAHVEALYGLWLGDPPAGVVRLSLLAMAVSFIMPFAAVVGTAMVALNRVRQTLWAPVLGLVANVAVSLALVGPLGIAGVITGTIVGETLSGLGYVAIFRALPGRSAPDAWPLVWRALGLSVAFAAGQVASTVLLPTLGALVAGGAVAAAHYAVLAATCLRGEERSALRGLLRRG